MPVSRAVPAAVAMPARVLGQLLLSADAIDEAELAAALAEQRRSRERIGEVLVRRGLDPEQVAQALAVQLRLPYAGPPLLPEPEALRMVDRVLALRHRLVPLRLVERGVRVALADPLDLAVLDDLRFQIGRRVEPVVATRRSIDAALSAAYDLTTVQALLRRLPDREGGADGPGGGAGVSGRGDEGVGGGGRADGAGSGGGGGGVGGVDSAGVVGMAGGSAGVAGRGVGRGEGSSGEVVVGVPGVEAEEVRRLRRASEAPPVVALVELILQRAVALRASDIHIEPVVGRLRVRARVDGVLREILELPEQTSAGIASRLKILAGMDIAVKRRPQDGRTAVWVEGRELALRVSTLPAQDGEKVVLRILDPENAGRRLDELGFDPVTLARFGALLGRGHGVLLVTGPTGSGKTTTLYGALAALDRERRNILTLEDPVEYRLPGLTQVQVHRRAGLSFAAAMRSVLRQDPDVIMVGELRDKETVETAMAAALTGHLVLSTLHTNDAPGAVTRLTEMGAPHYLIASGLIGVLAQRLVRRLCMHCREPRAPTPEELAGIQQSMRDESARMPISMPEGLAGVPPREKEGTAEAPPPLRSATFYESRGCARCDGTGYRGRVGVYELLTVDTTVRELIMKRASTDAIRDAARAGGMRTLGEDAREKVRAGVTTAEEVRPFVALLEEEAPTCAGCGTGVRGDFAACPGCGRILRAGCGCGRWFEEGWEYCVGCGARRGGEGRPAVEVRRHGSSAPHLLTSTAGTPVPLECEREVIVD
jgi:type II secretory ATPase GspE/PulE/Tfp pilus assembly ATPase PilB-like protein